MVNVFGAKTTKCFKSDFAGVLRVYMTTKTFENDIRYNRI